jgi:hypothetical protein
VKKRTGLLRYALEGHTHAGGGGGGGGGSSPYKGAYAGGTTYAVGDLVAYTKALWCANSSTTGTAPGLTSSVAGAFTGSDVNLGAQPAGQEFTTNATKTYTKVTLYANSGTIASGTKVYLRSSVGGSNLAVGTLVTGAAPGAPETVTFASPVTLAAGTYWLLAEGNFAAIIVRGSTTKTGVISAIGRFRYGTGWGSTGLETSHTMKFDLWAQDASPWDLVVQGV